MQEKAKGLPSPKDIMEPLHAECKNAFNTSFDTKYNQLNGESYALAMDFDVWTHVLRNQPECDLYDTASAEYIAAFLSASQGQYRDSFKGLRLVLELTLQGVYASANLVILKEWLAGGADTIWNTLVHNDNGVFAARFCTAFFPELVEEIAGYKTLAQTLYREMSECTHGNMPKEVPLPTTISFDEASFQLWHKKTRTLRLLVNFILTMRYLHELEDGDRSAVEPIVHDQLGTVAPIRAILGGPV